MRMNINGIFLNDPKDKTPSVSLTLMVVSFITALGGAIAHMMGKVQDTSIVLEVFFATSSLYFGRKWTSSKNSVIESTTPEEGK